MVQHGVKPGGHLEQEWLVGRGKTLEPEGQGQEEMPLEESRLVALGRSGKPVLQRWQRLQDRRHSCPVIAITARSEASCLGRRGGR